MFPANLYSTFAPYRLGDDFTGCECCVTPRDIAGLAARPLRELTGAELERYARKAMTTWGDVRHFKHFLPRLLELIYQPDETIDFELVFHKLAYAQLRTWPDFEQRVIQEFCASYWPRQLVVPVVEPTINAADSTLGAMSSAGVSIKPFLDTWLQTPTAAAQRQLAAFILSNESSLLQEGRLWHPNWNDAASEREVIAWLRSDAVLAYLVRSPENVLTDELVYAVPQLEAIRAALASAPL